MERKRALQKSSDSRRREAKEQVKPSLAHYSQHPVNAVKWVKREELFANNYNPNKVAPPELALLKLSIMEDGFTQPIVARRSGEIVDGFHRWLCSDMPEIRAMTDGHVPVVFLPDETDRSHQIMSTIRHNRARGTHYILKMAEIVQELKDEQKLTDEEIMKRLGMEDEEVERLYDRAGMPVRGSKDGFGKAKVPSIEASK